MMTWLTHPEKAVGRLAFSPHISFFKRPVSNTVPFKDITLIEVYSYLKSDYAKEQTERLRAITDMFQASRFKAENFDYVTFGGTFTTRRNTDIKFPSDLLCLDFDHVPNVPMYREMLLRDREFSTTLLFTSPSGNGIKWVIPIRTDTHLYEEVFRAVSNYIQSTYGLQPDQKCKDIARACFLPYDPEAYINPKYVPPYAER